MPQYILLQTYIGDEPSRFIFEVTCTGRKLDMEEVMKLHLTNRDLLRTHQNPNYESSWYEITPGVTSRFICSMATMRAASGTRFQRVVCLATLRRNSKASTVRGLQSTSPCTAKSPMFTHSSCPARKATIHHLKQDVSGGVYFFIRRFTASHTSAISSTSKR